MLVDYLTLALHPMLCPKEALEALKQRQNTILCITPDGERLWEIPERVSVRSDTHFVTARLDRNLVIQGSPARCMEDGTNNVFGSFDICECFQAMVVHVSRQLGCKLPLDPELWKARRVDVTGNYFLGCLTDVKQALNDLRHTEGGRYQVKTAAESVYWNYRSRLRAGKAYAKGPHMEYMIKQGKAQLSEKQLDMLQGVLRLELKLGSQFLRRDAELPWYDCTSEYLKSVYDAYFNQFVGSVEVSEMSDVRERLNEVAPTVRSAEAAYYMWTRIKEIGVERARAEVCRAVWYKRKKILNQAGLGWSDMQQRKVVPFRRKLIVLGDPVTSWNDLERRYDKQLCA